MFIGSLGLRHPYTEHEVHLGKPENFITGSAPLTGDDIQKLYVGCG